ncbi:MAG: hypothetical protein IMY79_02440 [Chloroflexi bacterium]|nr:hypothetical protein [Chloroflexota bacterium]
MADSTDFALENWRKRLAAKGYIDSSLTRMARAWRDCPGWLSGERRKQLTG